MAVLEVCRPQEEQAVGENNTVLEHDCYCPFNLSYRLILNETETGGEANLEGNGNEDDRFTETNRFAITLTDKIGPVTLRPRLDFVGFNYSLDAIPLDGDYTS